MKLPQRAGVVPAVIENHRVHDHTVLLDQVVAAETDGIQAVGLVQGKGVPSDVVPGVVVQEGAIGMCPLAFKVVEERPADLSGRRHAEHEALRQRLSAVQRRVAPQPA